MQLIDRKNFFIKIKEHDGEFEDFDRQYLAYAIGYTYGTLKKIELENHLGIKSIKTFLDSTDKFSDLKEKLMRLYKKMNNHIKHRSDKTASETDILIANLINFICTYQLETDALNTAEQSACISGLEDGKRGIYQ